MAIPPVIIQFLADGVPDVSRALSGVAALVTKAERATTAASLAGSSTRQRDAVREVTEKARAWSRAEGMIGTAIRAGNREVENRARADSRAYAAAASEKLRVANRVANEERRLRSEIVRANLEKGGLKHASVDHPGVVDALAPVRPGAASSDLDALRAIRAQQKIDAAKDAGRAREEREAAKLATKQSAEADKNAATEIRREEQNAKRKDAIRERSATMAGRLAAKQAAEEARAAEEAGRRRVAIARTISGAAGTGVRAAGGAIMRGANLLTQLGGGYSVADAVKERVHLRGELADIANRAVVTPEQAGGSAENAQRRSVDELQGAVNKVGVDWAIAPEKAAAALDKFGAKTGNLTRGLQLMNGLAEMSRAGAGDLDNLADAAGDVFNADKTQNAEQVLGVMRALSAQGKIGAVEMKDLATQMASLGAAAGRFQGDAGKNMAMMGGLAQLSRESGGSKSAAQATTAVVSLTNQLYKNKRIEGFKDLGVDVKDPKTGLNRDMDKILIETLQGAEKKSRAAGHGMQDFDVNFGAAVADAQARRATTPLEKAYKEAGGGSAGVKAAQDLLNKFAGAKTTKAEVSDAARARMQEADVQYERVVLQLKDATARELIPALTNIVPELTKLVPIVGDVAREGGKLAAWLAANPLKGLAAIIGVAMAKELALVGMKALFDRAITAALAGRGGGGVPGGGGPGSPLPGGGTIAKGVTLGVLSAAVTTNALLGYDAGVEGAQDLRAKVDAYRRGDRERGVSPEEAQRQIDQAKARLEKTGGTFNQVGNIIASPFSDSADKEYKQYKADQGLTESDAGRKLQELITALNENTQATRANSGAVPKVPTSGPLSAAPLSTGVTYGPISTRVPAKP